MQMVSGWQDLSFHDLSLVWPENAKTDSYLNPNQNQMRVPEFPSEANGNRIKIFRCQKKQKEAEAGAFGKTKENF